MSEISEKDLIIPALKIIASKAEEGSTTTELIKELRQVFSPVGKDAEILKGRKDDHFSQKVRNLRSHDTLGQYTNYRDNKYYINKKGREYISSLENYENVKELLKAVSAVYLCAEQGINIDRLTNEIKKYSDNDPQIIFARAEKEGYILCDDNKCYIEDKGIEFLSDNNALPEDSADIIEGENIDADIRDQIYFGENYERGAEKKKNEKSDVLDVVDDYFSLYDLKRRHERYKAGGERNAIVLNADFQREGSIWNVKNKSLLIESVLLGIPIPSIYASQGENGNLVIIDGRQRLTTIFSYMQDGFKLTGLKFKADLNGRKFSELAVNYQMLIEDQKLHFRLIRIESSEVFVIETFKRVNTQGVNLNAQEIRNALHQGQSTKLLNELSEGFIDKDSKRRKTYFVVSEKRMKDRYLMLRYFAMQVYYNHLYENKEKQIGVRDINFNNVSDFLSNTMKLINRYDDDKIKKMKYDFIKIYQRCLSVFGVNAFRLKEGSPINMIIFEISMLLADLLKDNTDEEIKEALNSFYNSNINKTDDKDVETPVEINMKYHRDAKDNIKQRLIWVNSIVSRINDKKN